MRTGENQAVFLYSLVNPDRLRVTLTDARLTKYLEESRGNIEAAVRLYVINTQLSEAL